MSLAARLALPFDSPMPEMNRYTAPEKLRPDDADLLSLCYRVCRDERGAYATSRDVLRRLQIPRRNVVQYTSTADILRKSIHVGALVRAHQVFPHKRSIPQHIRALRSGK